MVEPYVAISMSPDIERMIYAEKKYMAEVTKRNLAKVLAMLEMVPANLEAPVKLVAFPEFMLQPRGFQRKLSKIMEGQFIRIPGEETDKIGEYCKKFRFFFVGANHEVDDLWPDRFFNTAFIISPNGKVIHKGRKVHTTSNMVELATSPHDILDDYEEKSPWPLWPVCDTKEHGDDIGKIGTYICGDLHYPETSRALAMNGAEVIVAPTAWAGPGKEPMYDWDVSNRTACIANSVYGIFPDSQCAHMIIDFKGQVKVRGKLGVTRMVRATIDLDALREWRTYLKYNFIAQIRTEVYLPTYKMRRYPPNLWKKQAPETMADTWVVQAELIKWIHAQAIHGQKVHLPEYFWYPGGESNWMDPMPKTEDVPRVPLTTEVTPKKKKKTDSKP